MKSKLKQTAPAATQLPPGHNLRTEVEKHGIRLADSLSVFLGTLPVRQGGPQALSDLLGITVVTASRLLRAVAHQEPIAVVQNLPGTKPLFQTIDAAIAQGGNKQKAERAREAVAAFDQFVRDTAGNRGSLDAILMDWLPQGRREFEIRRRQSAFKAFSELRGVSSDLDLATIMVHPSEVGETLDILSIQGSFGLDRLRPAAKVRFGTRRVYSTDKERTNASARNGGSIARHPVNLDGELAYDGLHTVRLDQFCTSSPAPLEAKRFDEEIQYTLAETGFGPNSSVDLVMAEVNRAELVNLPLAKCPSKPFFFQLSATPTRAMLFDLLIHKDVWPDGAPKLMIYDTAISGPAKAGRPIHDVDLTPTHEVIETLGTKPSGRRFAGFPRYGELMEYACAKLDWVPENFRAYRLHMPFPLHGTQACMVMELSLADPSE